MLEGKEVKEYFEKHPESWDRIKGISFQFKLPKNFEPDEQIHRPIKMSDIKYISNGGLEGQKGLFAWYYPCGVPHYVQIAN